MNLVPPDLLAIMQCPVCAGTLEESAERSALVCSKCGRAYPVDDNGIPDMVVDESGAPEAGPPG